MNYSYIYESIVGKLLLESNGEFLTKLKFILDEKPVVTNLNKEVFKETIDWLDLYFKGVNPEFTPKYKYTNKSSFALDVLEITSKIPYGQTKTYGEIAKEVLVKRHMNNISAQAVGGALNKNDICIIVPCHRVIGKNNNLVGFGGTIPKKIKLLEIEGNDMSNFYYKGIKNE